MKLEPEEVKEIVDFFEKHSQYWKRSVFLQLLEENKWYRENYQLLEQKLEDKVND